MLFKYPLKVRLIGKPGFKCHIGNQFAATQPFLGELDSLVEHKRVGRHAVMLFERADQVGRR